MAFTLATGVTEVRALLNEETGSFWSDTELQNWIKQGCLDWCEKSLLYIVEDTITVVDAQVKYTTSGSSHIDNAIRTLHAEYGNAALQRVNYEQIRKHNARQLGSSVTPAYYHDQYNGLVFTFYLGPTPDNTVAGNNITVQFALRTDDITKIPYEYQQHIFLYAYSKAKIKERQYREATMAWQQYINNIMFARKDSLEHGTQPVETFRIS
jgi:hypothetical protein